MSQRHSGFIVILERDVRDDDAAPTLEAIKQIKGVLEVKPIAADPIGESLAATRLSHKIYDRFLQMMNDIEDGK